VYGVVPAQTVGLGKFTGTVCERIGEFVAL
jgi:hypothetical protein